MRKLGLLTTVPALLLTVTLSACGGGGDTTNPTVTLNPVSTPVTIAGNVTLSAKASDDTAIKQVDFYLDGTLVASDTSADSSGNYTTSINLDASKNGAHTIKAVAVDTSSNQSTPAEQTIQVNIDNVKPVVTLTGIPTSVTTAGSYTISGSASDNVGVTRVHVVLTRTDGNGVTTTLIDNETTQTSFTYPVVVDSALNGTYTLTATAWDAAGNVGTATQSTVVNIQATTPNPDPTPDTTPPTLTITVPPSPITVAGNYDVLVSATDNVGVVSLTGTITSPLGTFPLGSGSLNNTGGTVTVPVSKAMNGDSTLTLTARDAAGNTTTKSVTVTVTIP